MRSVKGHNCVKHRGRGRTVEKAMGFLSSRTCLFVRPLGQACEKSGWHARAYRLLSDHLTRSPLNMRGPQKQIPLSYQSLRPHSRSPAVNKNL
jgi:hypothetical protein